MNDTTTMTTAIDDPNVVMEDALSTIQATVEALSVAEQEKEALVKKAAIAEKEFEKKLAEAKTSIFKKADVEHLCDRLSAIGIIPPGMQSKVANHLCNNPESALSFIDQIAEVFTAPPVEGVGVEKSGTFDVEDDPDGWSDWAHGRHVQLRR
jgi:hypothetical protein